MPPRRLTAAASGTIGKEKENPKATTPSVLHFFGSTSPVQRPTDPVRTTLEVSSASRKSVQCELYSAGNVADAAPRDGTAPSEPRSVSSKLIFTHGAGGGLSNAATTCFASGFAQSATALVFEGGPNLVGRTKQFQAVLQHVLDARLPQAKDDPLPALGGRSLGARAAVQTANAATSCSPPSFATLVLVSYPLIGPSGDIRDAILCDVHPSVDVLFVSGDRDNMCDLEQLNGVRKRMRAHSWLAVVRGADHGMSCKPASAVEARRTATGALAARWLTSRDRNRTECVLFGTEIEEWRAAAGQDNNEKKDKRHRDEAEDGVATKEKKKAKRAR